MTLRGTIWTVLSLLLVAGTVLGLQPRNWIELGLGIDPDGGSGFLEFLMAAVPIAAGLALGAQAVLKNSWRRHGQTS